MNKEHQILRDTCIYRRTQEDWLVVGDVCGVSQNFRRKGTWPEALTSTARVSPRRLIRQAISWPARQHARCVGTPTRTGQVHRVPGHDSRSVSRTLTRSTAGPRDSPSFCDVCQDRITDCGRGMAACCWLLLRIGERDIGGNGKGLDGVRWNMWWFGIIDVYVVMWAWLDLWECVHIDEGLCVFAPVWKAHGCRHDCVCVGGHGEICTSDVGLCVFVPSYDAAPLPPPRPPCSPWLPYLATFHARQGRVAG